MPGDGRVPLGEVELLVVRLLVGRRDLQGMMDADAGGDAGRGRVPLNHVRVMRGLRQRGTGQRQCGGNQGQQALAICEWS